MAKKEELIIQDKLSHVSSFVEERKSIYAQELTGSETEVEKFVWSQMIALLDEISGILEAE
jgi:hypothetical protein